MKYMNWSWDQLMVCPEPVYRAIFSYAEKEAQEAEAERQAAARA